MLELIIGSNLNRKTVIVDPSTTPKAALDANGIDYTVGNIHLDGVTLNTTDMNKTFAALGVQGKASLIVVVKGDAA